MSTTAGSRPPGPLTGPFPFRLAQRSDRDGATLTLRAPMTGLRLAFWSLVSLSLPIAVVAQTDMSVALFLLGTVAGGLLYEQLVLVLAHRLSWGSRAARWIAWTLLGALHVAVVVAADFDPLAILVLVVQMLLMGGLFELLAGRAPTLRLEERMLRMEEWRPVGFKRDREAVRVGRTHQLTIPLEGIQSVQATPSWNPWRGRVVLELAEREVPVWSGPLRSAEQLWLVEAIQQRVEARRAVLLEEGHDLRAAEGLSTALEAVRSDR